MQEYRRSHAKERGRDVRERQSNQEENHLWLVGSPALVRLLPFGLHSIHLCQLIKVCFDEWPWNAGYL